MTSDGTRPSLTALVLGQAVVAAARFEHLAKRGREGSRVFLGSLAGEALAAEELERLTVRLYATAPEDYSSGSLYDWEAALFARELPAPPASVLVTAAGSGREARVLSGQGYAVDALEPVPAMAAACAGVPGIGTVLRATHDDLVGAVEGRGGVAAALAARRYDAVVVGWGSFTHVLGRTRQRRLLAACDRLAPSGPVLISFFARGKRAPPRTRARALGVRVGQALAARRGLEPKGLQIGFAWHLGFTHQYTAEEIDELAAEIGRTAEVGMTPYGHAVLRPSKPV